MNGARITKPGYGFLLSSSENYQHRNNIDLIFKVTWLFIGNPCIHDSSQMDCAKIIKLDTWVPPEDV